MLTAAASAFLVSMMPQKKADAFNTVYLIFWQKTKKTNNAPQFTLWGLGKRAVFG